MDTVRPFQNIAKRGEDLKKGAIINDHPLAITPAAVSMLAAIGKHSVTVEKSPRVAIISTGDEVVAIDKAVSEVEIRNSNAWLLRALLAKENIQPFSVVHVPDDQEQIQQAFKNALDADIIISCGGVSAGDADYVPGVVKLLGVQKLFHKLMIRPGKPIWCGRLPGNGMLFALPGNPLSCMVTFTLFVRPFIYACYGLPQPVILPVTLKHERAKKNLLDEFFPVKIIDGSTSVEAVPFSGSGDIRAALFADGIARHPREKAMINAGETVEYIAL